MGATRSPLLDVDRVEVRGARRTPRPALVSAAGLGPGTLMVEVDGEGLTRRVQGLPWVLRARAERSWPATVVIHVTERAPAAAVRAAGGGWAVVD
ncbi:MAG: FtsQ-type POTRA domain-containing protein, partial [Actinomycetota bacterium]|nr:FtsQ-type POTRA domain-containing protein [Actinomycetota bacterium]